MKNTDLSIRSIVNKNGHPYHTSKVAFDNNPLVFSLSKREHYAALAWLDGIDGC